MPSTQRQRPDSFILMLRSFAILFFSILATILWAGLAQFVVPFRPHSLIHWMATRWGKTVRWISRVHVEVEGIEKLHRDGPVILLSNHQSLFDVVVFYSFLDIQFRWMAKASLFKIPIFGWGMWGAGYIPVEREDKKRALHSLYDAAREISEGKSVIIFPEGTRGAIDGTLRPFKKGAFLLAKKAGVVLQPVTIWGGNEIVPKIKGKIIQRIYPGTVRAILHDPIHPEEYKKIKVEALQEKIRGIIESPIEDLKQKQRKDPELNRS